MSESESVLLAALADRRSDLTVAIRTYRRGKELGLAPKDLTRLRSNIVGQAHRVYSAAMDLIERSEAA